MTSKTVYFRTNKSHATLDMKLESGSLREQIIAALRTVYDPEIPVNLYDLGLIYAIDISEQNDVAITMTLTAPGCPVAGVLLRQVEQAIAKVEQVKDVKVNIVWDPPWTQDKMSEVARLELGMY